MNKEIKTLFYLIVGFVMSLVIYSAMNIASNESALLHHGKAIDQNKADIRENRAGLNSKQDKKSN